MPNKVAVVTGGSRGIGRAIVLTLARAGYQIALSYAIEKAVYALIMEGSMTGLWCMGTDADKSQSILLNYLTERDSISAPNTAQLPVSRTGTPITGVCSAPRTAQAPRPVEKVSTPKAVAPSATTVLPTPRPIEGG